MVIFIFFHSLDIWFIMTKYFYWPILPDSQCVHALFGISSLPFNKNRVGKKKLDPWPKVQKIIL